MNKIFSPNMLKTFKQCPQKYNLRFVEQIYIPQKETVFEKGKKIHALANYYLKREYTDKFEKVLTPAELKLWQSLKNNEYFNKEYVNSEYYVSFKIDKYWLGGRIDAIVKDDSAYYILDYKTGEIPQFPEKDYQTMIYSLALTKLLKDATQIKFIYIDLKNNKNYIIEFTDEILTKYEKELTEICKTISLSKEYPKNCSKYCEYINLC